MPVIHFGKPVLCGMPDEDVFRRASSWTQVTCEPCTIRRLFDVADSAFAQDWLNSKFTVHIAKNAYNSLCGASIVERTMRKMSLAEYGVVDLRCRQCLRFLDSQSRKR